MQNDRILIKPKQYTVEANKGVLTISICCRNELFSHKKSVAPAEPVSRVHCEYECDTYPCTPPFLDSNKSSHTCKNP